MTELTKVTGQEWLYAKALDRLAKADEAYEEECKTYAEQGYAPHYCKHGTNLWTDYDNICGPCEDGSTNEELARYEANRIWAKYESMLLAAIGLMKSGFPQETITRLMSEAGTIAGFPDGGTKDLYL